MGQNVFSLPTGDHPFGQSADYSSTQGDSVLLDNPDLSSDRFGSPFPQVSPQKSEYVSGVGPELPIQEQLGQTFETNLQLGSEIQTFELHVNGSGPDQVRERSERTPTDSLKLRQLVYHGSERLPTSHQ